MILLGQSVKGLLDLLFVCGAGHAKDSVVINIPVEFFVEHPQPISGGLQNLPQKGPSGNHRWKRWIIKESISSALPLNERSDAEPKLRNLPQIGILSLLCRPSAVLF